MKSLRSAPLIIFSALLAGSTALSSDTFAACTNCRQNQTVSRTTSARKRLYNQTSPRITTRQEIFANTVPVIPEDDKDNLVPARQRAFRGPIFGDDDCSRNGGPMFGDEDCSYADSGPMFGENVCINRKCGGAMFGPQTCKKVGIPCKSCQQQAPLPPTPRFSYIQKYKTVPSETIYEKVHKCSELAPIQLEWVDFRIPDAHSESYSRKLGNYRFRLFGCRRFSKNAMLNEGRIIQKDMHFIDIFEDVVNDCYNIVKVPNDLCLRDQDYEAPEYILTAEITDYFMNVCDGYDWDEAQATDKRTGSAEMTVTWRLLDLTKTKIIWKGETNGYSDLDDGSYNGEIDLIERAFADAVLNLKGLPEFEAQLAQRVPPKILEQQKATLLAIEQASDPIKCKIDIPQATICPMPEPTETNEIVESVKPTIIETGGVDGTGYSTEPQQCPMQAEVIEYQPQEETMIYEPETAENDTIPLEFGQVPYAENSGSICYGYNNENEFMDFKADSIGEGYQIETYPIPSAGVCDSTLNNFLEPEENACENPLFGKDGQDCDPSLLTFIKADQECPGKGVEQVIEVEEPAPQICLFSNDISSAGGISKDSGYSLPEVDMIEPVQIIKTAPDWLPYEKETESREPEIIPEPIVETEEILPPCPEGVERPVMEIIQNEDGTTTEKPTCYVKVVEEEPVPECPADITTPETKIIENADGTITEKPACRVKIIEEKTPLPPEIIEKGDYREADNFCIENIAPYPDMRPENLYRVRASMMSVRNGLNKQSAGLLIADDLILTSADAVDESSQYYDVETINGVKAKAKVVRINVKKNIALLQTTQKMYFRPLSLNMELPPVGDKGYMSLGLLNNAEGENYLDDKGTIKGYRFSETMGTEIITDTFVQTVSSGGALIDKKGVVSGLASRNQKFDDKGDLFLPIQDAINSVGLKVCGQAQPFVQPPMAVIKPISTAIDSYKGSREPAVLAKKKRK